MTTLRDTALTEEASRAAFSPAADSAERSQKEAENIREIEAVVGSKPTPGHQP
jgi:hypothetical protein